MSNYITLLGAEAVERAGSKMQTAAGEIQQAALNIEGSLERHRLFMDDWLRRMEQILAEYKP